jgi:integrase
VIRKRVRRRDGKTVYDARLRNPDGREYSRTFLTKKEAQAFEAAEWTARNRGACIDPRVASTPYKVLAEDWLRSNPTKQPSSLMRDRVTLRNQVLPVLGNRTVASITRADIQGLLRSWMEGYPATTVVRMFATLRATFSYAELAEMIGRNPCRGVRLPEAPPRESVILDADDLERVARAMKSVGPMVYLGALGMRWGEIAGLRVGRLDFLHRTITIAVQRTGGDGNRMVEHEPKTKAGRRTISVPDWIMTMLSEHLAARGLTGADADAYVFVSPTGLPLRYSDWLAHVWWPTREAAGFPRLRFHDVRHTAATLLVAEGVDIKTVQVRLGHADPHTTLRVYAQATQRADQDAAERVGPRIRPRDARGMKGHKPD